MRVNRPLLVAVLVAYSCCPPQALCTTHQCCLSVFPLFTYSPPRIKSQRRNSLILDELPPSSCIPLPHLPPPPPPAPSGIGTATSWCTRATPGTSCGLWRMKNCDAKTPPGGSPPSPPRATSHISLRTTGTASWRIRSGRPTSPTRRRARRSRIRMNG